MLRANDGYIVIRVTSDDVGTVVSVDEYYTDFEKDQVVYFPVDTGHTIEYKGETLLVLRIENILAYEVDENLSESEPSEDGEL